MEDLTQFPFQTLDRKMVNALRDIKICKSRIIFFEKLFYYYGSRTKFFCFPFPENLQNDIKVLMQ